MNHSCLLAGLSPGFSFLFWVSSSFQRKKEGFREAENSSVKYTAPFFVQNGRGPSFRFSNRHTLYGMTTASMGSSFLSSSEGWMSIACRSSRNATSMLSDERFEKVSEMTGAFRPMVRSCPS